MKKILLLLLLIPTTARAEKLGAAVVTADSEYSSTYAAPMIYDGSLSTYWQASGVLPHWVKFVYTSSSTPTEYRAYGVNSSYSPTAWKFQASNDGSTWVDLDIRTDTIGAGTWAIFPVSNSQGFWHQYRMYITSSGGQAAVALYEFEIYGSTEIPAVGSETSTATIVELGPDTGRQISFLFGAFLFASFAGAIYLGRII